MLISTNPINAKKLILLILLNCVIVCNFCKAYPYCSSILNGFGLLDGSLLPQPGLFGGTDCITSEISLSSRTLLMVGLAYVLFCFFVVLIFLYVFMNLYDYVSECMSI